MTLVDELPDNMALRHVRGFMRQHARQFVLVSRCQYQSALDGNEAAGHRKRVDHRIADDEVVELVLAFFGVLLVLDRLTWLTSELETAMNAIGLGFFVNHAG